MTNVHFLLTLKGTFINQVRLMECKCLSSSYVTIGKIYIY